MRPVHLLQLLLLAALWGASFLFIRVGVTDFGVMPLMGLRVAIGALVLLAALAWHRPPRATWLTARTRAWPLVAVGVLNAAAPFCLFAYAEQTLSASVTSVINATAPLWGAVIAALWLNDRLDGLRITGLAIGFVGVLVLVGDQIRGSQAVGASPGGTAVAAGAAFAATLLYGVAASVTRRYLHEVHPLVIATGTMSAAALILAPFTLASWPATPVSWQAWGSVLTLGIACTGIAFMMYFHLIATIGPTRAITVTFGTPVFGLLWGTLLLDEPVSPWMFESCLTIVAGMVLATGPVRRLPFAGNRSRRRGRRA